MNTDSKTAKPNTSNSNRLQKNVIFIYALLCLIGISFVLTDLYKTKKELQSDFIKQTEIIASSIDQSDVLQLTGKSSDTSLPIYAKIKQQLYKNSKAIPHCRFTYLMYKKADSIYFYVDSEPSTSKDCSPAGQVYSEASANIFKTFTSKVKQYDGPMTDRWGTWFSSFVPIINPSNSEVVAVMGVDVSVTDWNKLMFKNSVLQIVLILSSLVLIILSFSFGLKAMNLKNRARQIAESEERFRNMFATHKAVMLLINPKTGEIINANDAAVHFYGYTKMQLCSMKISDINCFENSVILNSMNKAQGHITNEFIFQHKLADGKIKTVQVMSSPIKTEMGDYLFSIIHDITEKQEIEKKIKESEELFKEFADAVDQVFVLRTKDKILYVNPKFEEVFGIPCETYYKNPRAFLSYLALEDQMTITDNIERVDYTLKGKTNEEYRIVKPNGELRWIKSQTFPIVGIDGTVDKIAVIASDITEQKKLEQERQSANENFISIFKTNPDPIIITKASNGIIIDINDQFLATSGYAKEDLIGKTSAETMAYDNDQERIDIINDLKTIGFTHNKKVKFNTKYHSKIDCILSSKSIVLNNELHFITTIRDISDIIVVETKLKTSEENFRTFFNSIDDFLFVLDRQGNIVTVNETVRRRLQYHDDELLGQPILKVHPEALRAEAGRIVSEMLAETTDFCPVPLITKSGEYIQVETRIYHGQWNGVPALFGVTKDVTKVKQSEERFAKAFDAGASLMSISEIETGIFLNVNKAFLKTTGYTKEEVVGKTAAELHLFSNAGDRTKTLRKMVENGSVADFEVQINVKEGEPRIGLFSIKKLNVGDKACWLTTMTDITERKQMENELKERGAQLQLITDNLPVIICQFDRDSTYLFVNKLQCETFNLKYTDFIGQHTYDILGMKLFENTKQYRDKVLQGESVSFEIKLEVNQNERIFKTTYIPQFEGTEVVGFIMLSTDITEQKRMEEQIQSTALRLELARQSGQIGVWDYDVVNNNLYWDDRMFELYGITANEFSSVYDAWIHGLHPDDVERGNTEIQLALLGEKEFDTEFRVIHPNGDVRIIKGSAQVLRDADGKGIRMVGVNTDITERKRIEETLRLRESYLLAIIENQPGLIWLKDQTGTFLAANTKFSQSCNINKPELLIGKTDFDIWPKELAAKYVADDCNVITSGASYLVEEIIKDNGIEKTFETFKTPIKDSSGNVIGTTGFSRDITERKEAEAARLQSNKQWEAIISASPDGICISSFDGTLQFVSNNLMKIYGYENDEREQFIGRNLFEFIHPLSHSLIRENAKKIIASEQNHGISEYLALKKDGSSFYVEINSTVLRNAQGEPTSILSVERDITERKIVEKALLLSKEAAEAASLAKSDFLATMSHEIRTPLNGVIGFSDILMKTKLTEKQFEYMRNVNVSANSLLDLVNDILDFSKIEAGKLELNSEKLDVIEMAESVMDIMSFRFSEKNIEPLLNIAPSVPRNIIADPIRLRQVLINLLGNASKFTEQGEIELQIEALPIADKEGEMEITFSIRDTGIGIAQNKQQDIFESFTQADNSTTRKYGGTGLGLAISSSLVQKMGSQIHLQSEEGIGSCFSFTLTLSCEQSNIADSFDISWIKKVLVVDDNANNCNIVATMLETKHIVTEQATNGIMALEMMQKSNDYDVVIVDYHMPYMDGLQVIHNIRQNMKMVKQPVVFLHSSSDYDTISTECNRLDVKYILVKPIRMSQLFDSFMKINPHLPQTESELQEQVVVVQEKTTMQDIFTVLIVDDNEMNLKLASSLITINMPNAVIVETKQGQKACELYQKHHPDIVLMDIQMPIMNGYEAAGQIRATEQDTLKRVPIIALSAGTVAGEKDRCIEAGMDDYIPKPLRPQVLLAAFEKYLHGNVQPPVIKPKVTINTLVHFDRDDILATYNNEVSIVNTLLSMVFTGMPSYLSELEKALITNDPSQIKFNAHTIKGMAKGIGFTILADYALQIEKSIELNSEHGPELYTLLVKEYEFLKKEYGV